MVWFIRLKPENLHKLPKNDLEIASNWVDRMRSFVVPTRYNKRDLPEMSTFVESFRPVAWVAIRQRDS